MKATGIVRRIDDLGRIVIPKEIRRIIRVREGDPMEIFVGDGGQVIIQKYSPVNNLRDFALEYVEALHESLDCVAMVADTDLVIAVAGASKRDYLDRPVGEIRIIMENRHTFMDTIGTGHKIIFGTTAEHKHCIMAPIHYDGETYGAVILLSGEGEFVQTHVKMAEVAAAFFAKNMKQVT